MADRTKTAGLTAWLLVTLAACNHALLRDAPDAQPDPETGFISTRDCPTAPFATCDAMAPGAGGCMGEPEAVDAAASLLPVDASFPIGCTVNVPSTYKTPQDECLVAYSCRCVAPRVTPRTVGDDAGTQWRCQR